MPELPEVETVRKALAQTLEGNGFSQIQINRPDLRFPFPTGFQEQLQDQTILAVRRRAKYLLVDFDHGTTLIWHLGMSGRVIIENKDTRPTPYPHDHVIFLTSQNHRVIYRDPRRFGFMLLTSTATLNNTKPFSILGPEPLEPLDKIMPIFIERLQKRSMPIKSALLDQNIIAGVGNIYASEALWQARISPLKSARQLTSIEIERLLKELQDVLQRAITAGGSTLRDHAQPNGEAGYFQHSFKVYAQQGTLCQSCQITALEKIIQNGRATYYCIMCQV